MLSRLQMEADQACCLTVDRYGYGRGTVGCCRFDCGRLPEASFLTVGYLKTRQAAAVVVVESLAVESQLNVAG